MKKMEKYHVLKEPINFLAKNDHEAINCLFNEINNSGEYKLMRKGGLTFFSGYVDLEKQEITGRHLTHRQNINRKNGHH